MNLQHIQSFVAVSKAGAFIAASRQNDLHQGGLSRDIKSLEDYLGVSLFKRHTAGVELTKLGQTVLPWAERLVTMHADTCSTMALWRTKQAGRLLIAGSLAVMPKLIPSFFEALTFDFPDLQVELKNDLSDRVEEAVRDGAAALGLTATVNQKPEFIYSHVLEAPLGVIFSEKLHLAENIESLEDLRHIPFLRFHDQAVISQALMTEKNTFDSFFQSRLTVSNVEAGLELIQQGKFCMLITGVGAESQIAKGLRFLPLPDFLPSIRVSIITKRDAPFDERRESIKLALVECMKNMVWHSSIKIF
jgi:DNA-binding transcriptional LysR family regulator